MPLKKILVGVTLVAFLGSDFAFGIAPALGQSPGAGNGPVPMPSLGGNSDGFGRVLPGPSTTAPYQNAPQPQREPQTPYPTQSDRAEQLVRTVPDRRGSANSRARDVGAGPATTGDDGHSGDGHSERAGAGDPVTVTDGRPDAEAGDSG